MHYFIIRELLKGARLEVAEIKARKRWWPVWDFTCDCFMNEKMALRYYGVFHICWTGSHDSTYTIKTASFIAHVSWVHVSFLRTVNRLVLNMCFLCQLLNHLTNF
jgi:hypothetical protein